VKPMARRNSHSSREIDASHSTGTEALIGGSVSHRFPSNEKY